MEFNNPIMPFIVLGLFFDVVLIFSCFRFASRALMSKRKGLKYKGNRKNFTKCTFFSVISGMGSAFVTFVSVTLINATMFIT